jgi:lipoate-protein ligase A
MKWVVTTDRDSVDPQVAIGQDDMILAQVMASEAPATVRIWQTPQCISVPRHFSLHDRFDDAALTLADRGWPITLRSSGGSAMPQGPGVLNISMVFPHDRPMSIEAGFQLLTDPLRAFFESLGLPASVGSVPGSFCDGRYNLVVDQRKIAGTAQRRKKRALLAHAALQINLDLEVICRSINYLNEKIDRVERCQPDAATTVAMASGRVMSATEIEQKLVTFFRG